MRAIDLINLLEPYQAELNQYSSFKSITDSKRLNDLLSIWDEFKNLPEVSAKIYGAIKKTPPTNRGCGSCVGEAISSLINWKKHIEKEVDYHYSYKGIPQAKVTEEKPSFEGVPFIKLRKMAKDKGIAFTNKTKKDELIKLLNGGL
jgi:hypothetical protein